MTTLVHWTKPLWRITLNGGPGWLERCVAEWKTWIFRGLASCTNRWAGRLHYRTGQWAAKKGGPEGCPFLQPTGPTFCAARCLSILYSVQQASPPKIHVFHLETRPSGPQAFQLVLSFRKGYVFWICQDHFKQLCFSKGKRAPAVLLPHEAK